MATTNPNVPADQKATAETSAPNAKVTAQQPAQLPTGNQTTANATAVPVTPTAAPAPAPAPTARTAQTQPADSREAAKSVEGDKKAQEGDKQVDRKAEVNQEQETLKSITAEVEGKDYFEQQRVFGEAFEEREGEDSFRRAARIEREREALLAAGDPTRDPVAKQRAMDMNTVLPGAVEDAQKIKDIGAEKLEEQSPAFKGTK
jgi:hypothetical protein